MIFIRTCIRQFNFDLVTAESRVVTIQPEALTKNRLITTSAVYVDGYRSSNSFIATQMPMDGFVDEFWCMVKQNQVNEIIILNDEEVNF
jgi:protein tyrosine phosphatase